MRSAASPVDITVMICTWNNCRRLGETLQALTGCGPRSASWQLVVVNNNCADATDATVRQHEAALPLVLTHESRPGLSKARNRGLAVSRGSLVVFTDDDVTPARGWLDAYWDACRAHPRCFFGGPVRSRFDGPAPDPRLVPFAPASVVGLDFGRAERPLSDDEVLHRPELGLSAGASRPGRRLRRGPRPRPEQRRGQSRRGVGPDAPASGGRRRRGVPSRRGHRASCVFGQVHGGAHRRPLGGVGVRRVPGVCRARTCRASSGIPGGSSRGSFGPPAWPAGVASPAATGSRPTWNSAGRWERCAPSGTNSQAPIPNSQLPTPNRQARRAKSFSNVSLGSWELAVGS